jgi:hypothetical protein
MVTLDNLIDIIRQRCDIVGSQHITDSEIINYINLSGAELYGIIIDSFEDYYVSTIAFSLTSVQDSYELPSDFFKELRIDKSYSGNPNNISNYDWIRLQRINIKDECNYNSTPLRSLYYPRIFGYLIYGNKLKIVPKSEIQGSYQMLYYPHYIDLVNSKDICTQFGPTGQHWEELVIVDVCIKCAIKGEDSNVPEFMAQKQAVIDRIKKEASNRIAGDAAPPQISGPRWYDRGFGSWVY